MVVLNLFGRTKTMRRGAMGVFSLLLSHSAMAAGNWFTDWGASVIDGLLIGLAGLIILLGMAYMTIVTLAVFMLSDATLVISAIFMPFALAFYPIANSWATAAVGAIVSASMVKVAGAFFVNEILKNGGVIDTALAKGTQALASAGAAGAGVGLGDAVGPIFQVCVGVLVIFVISTMVIQSIPGIVSSVFGGFSIHTPSFGGAKMAGAALAAAGGAAVGGAAGFVGGSGFGGRLGSAIKGGALGAINNNKASSRLGAIAAQGFKGALGRGGTNAGPKDPVKSSKSGLTYKPKPQPKP